MRYFISVIGYMCLTILCNSCDENIQTGELISTYIDISVRSIEGKDLLDPNVESSLKMNQIEIRYLNGSELLSPSRGDEPFLIEEPSGNMLRIFGNEEFLLDNETIQTIYVSWSDTDTDTDTLNCQFDQSEDKSSVRVVKVWFNENVVWNIDSGEARQFKIIK